MGRGDRAEVPGEADLLHVVDRLVAEKQHLVFQQSFAQACDGCGVQFFAQIDARHLGADQRRCRVEPQIRPNRRAVDDQGHDILLIDDARSIIPRFVVVNRRLRRCRPPADSRSWCRSRTACYRWRPAKGCFGGLAGLSGPHRRS
jgi:hypothetical protein